MKSNLIIALCIVIIAVNADKKADLDKCVTTCADTRKTEIAKLTGIDLTKAKDEIATFEKCAYNKDSTDGTVEIGTTYATKCDLFQMDKDFSDANMPIYTVNRNKCINKCESRHEFESKLNKDWFYCDQFCRTETFSEEKLKTLYKCFYTCDINYEESMSKEPQEKDSYTQEQLFMMTYYSCLEEEPACQEFIKLNENWEDANYLDKRYACESSCYKKVQQSQYIQNQAACQAKCTKAFESSGGNSESSSSQDSQFVLGAFIALAFLVL